MFMDFFKRRKFHAIAFAEIETHWTVIGLKDDAGSAFFSIVFFENGNGERKWTVAGGDKSRTFEKTIQYPQCETWKHTGLLPKWAKDPLAEKLSR